MILYSEHNKLRKVFLKESQVILLKELTNKDFTYNKDTNSINVSIPYSPNDKDNDIADTRLLGNPKDILSGQDGIHGMSSRYAVVFRNLEIYKRLYEYLINYQNEYGIPQQEDIPNLLKPRNPFIVGLKAAMGEYFDSIQKKISSMFDGSFDWNNILRNSYSTYSKWKTKYSFDSNFFNRANMALYDDEGNEVKKPNKIPRYRVGIVPGTNLKVISVFKFNNFNISDALKNGRFRQDDLTDSLLGITDKSEREIDRKYNGAFDTMKEIPATYDNGITPIIPNNFSYNQDGNTKIRYGINGTNANGNDYNSITQFIDKSIMGAAYALRKENVNPDFIVSVPSSSKFNVYYSKRLSEKIGKPYLEDFFKKNIIGVTIDKSIYDSGLPTSAIQELEQQLVSASLNVLSKEITLPIVSFFKRNSRFFENNKSNIPLDVAIAFIFDKVYDFIKDYASKSDDLAGDVSSLLISRIKKNVKQHGYYNLNAFTEEFEYIIQNSNLKEEFDKCISDVLTSIRSKKDEIINGVKISKLMSLDKSLNSLYEKLDDDLGKLHGNNKKDRLFIQNKFNKSLSRLNKKITNIVRLKDEFSFILQEWSPSVEKKRFKATDVKFNVRPYIENAYVIGDDYADRFNHFYNRKFVLFDEDMNSGASLKMTAKALENNGVDEEQITCLVNAYKLEG